MVDHLKKEDVYYWLKDIEKLPDEVVDYIWEKLGGSMLEICQAVMSYRNTGHAKITVDDLIQTEREGY